MHPHRNVFERTTVLAIKIHLIFKRRGFEVEVGNKLLTKRGLPIF
jgi:hypothetical protein